MLILLAGACELALPRGGEERRSRL